MDMKVGEHLPMGVSENGVYPKNGHFKKKIMIIGVLSTILSDKPICLSGFEEPVGFGTNASLNLPNS